MGCFHSVEKTNEMKFIHLFSLIISFFFTGKLFAQHDMHQHEIHKPLEVHRMNLSSDSTIHHNDSMMDMSHSFSRNLPMTRNGSGTGWLPDASVMYGHGIHSHKWMFMLMGNIFVRYNKQDITDKGRRGGEKFDVPNWLMFTGQKNIGKKGLFRFSSMFSLDPITVGSEGYPLLFQSGETYRGKRLVDRQHPHDLFSELSMGYTHMLSKNMDVTAYLGFPGEPAIGSVAFMHRNSAINNPDAPLSHHWQDATHITFGVATLGFRYKIFKIEGSSFTGREPDENRYDFEKPRFDSYSIRFLCNPIKELALQVSQAFLESPEVADPLENINRTTASLIHNLPLNIENKYLTTTIAWGLNNSDHKENSILIEPTLQLDRTAFYGRYEWIEKSAHELNLSEFNNGHQAIFKIQAFTLGVSQVLIRKIGNNLALGMQGSIFMADQRLEPIYGENPLSGEIYLRLYPHLMHVH
jgi:hypothetical protein